MMNCPKCGDPLRALLTSTYCPNGCDDRPSGVLCPSCGSMNTELFDISGILDCFAADDVIHDSRTYHCWPCGEVWNIEPEKPETD